MTSRTSADGRTPAPLPAAAPAPVPADELAQSLIEVMTALVDVVRQESDLVRAGRLDAAGKLAQAKADLARRYMADTVRLQAAHGPQLRLSPDRRTALRARHEAFRALLQTNLTVLATAHAVSEGIVRGVAGEIARKSQPQTYGASGCANAPSRNASAPLTVSRTL